MSDSRYHRVGLEVDDDSATLGLNSKTATTRKALIRDALIAVGGVVLGAVLVLLLFGLPINRDQVCSKYLSAYDTPLLKDVGIKFQKHRFNPASHSFNPYQQVGGPDSKVDEAWDALGVHMTRVTLPQAQGLAAGLKGHVRVPGSEDYIGFVEVLHHLHCLNMLRKGLFFNVEYYRSLNTRPFNGTDDFLQYHLSHCLDVIREQLMCNADFNLYGYVQIRHAEGFGRIFPAYDREHVCRNFEDVRAWAIDNQDSRLDDMHRIMDELEIRDGDIVLEETP